MELCSLPDDRESDVADRVAFRIYLNAAPVSCLAGYRVSKILFNKGDLQEPARPPLHFRLIWMRTQTHDRPPRTDC